MANRNHSLDSGIIEAAKHEFLEKGYDGASLRKIAGQAGITIGAIRTRYRTKDDLFQSLVQPFVTAIGEAFLKLKKDYYSVEPDATMEHLKTTMQEETDTILGLIFSHYEEAVLLFCCSKGSRLETFFDRLVEQKIAESLSFFSQYHITGLSESAFRMIIYAQYDSYRQIVSSGLNEEAARESMKSVMRYHIGGWTALFDSMKEDE